MKRFLSLLPLGWLVCASLLPAQELDIERQFEERNLGPVAGLLASGEYERCAAICEAVIQRGLKSPAWRVLRLRSLMATGHEKEASEEVQVAVKDYPDHLELLMLQHDNALRLGRQDVADQALKAINEVARRLPAKERSAADWVALGRAALALKADAKKVIQQYYASARKKDPQDEAAYLAEGHLALAKNDAQRAAETFRAGLKAHGESADLRAGLARAFAGSDRSKQAENLARALELNPRQVDALLDQAEMLIQSEKFMEAEATLQKVIEVRANCPEAWALRAALMQLSVASVDRVATARAQGLTLWERNPAVDHGIGRVLSRAYRFEEGASYQRKALEFDPDYLPAQIQLCHDLLRLGDEEEAWKLAAAIRAKDGYNVQAHNLGKLEQEMRGYVTQRFEDFILKMPKRDWPIYGERALQLLREAKATLAPKYGWEEKKPVLVEFFGAQQDFAIRTFGSLGGQGLLGVCFGTVITINSPGSLAHGRNNWEATLWHEFCHVVTLTQTRNRMPRWLSEGISVHEEGLRDPAWGLRLNADFRRMILEGNATTPIGSLSGAFMNPKSEDHLLLAYYQSAQVVRYLIQRFGQTKFQALLKDLAVGQRINDALVRHLAPLEQLERDFDQHLRELAQREFGALADWKKPGPDEVNATDPEAVAAFRRQHPHNLWALQRLAQWAVDAEQWDEVIRLADAWIRLVPEDASADSGYVLKAMALRKLGRADEEKAELRRIAERDPSALPIFLRLIELDRAAGNWEEVRVQARRVLALNPFLRGPQQALAEAEEALGAHSEAIAAYRRVLIMDPSGAAMTHFRLARLLKEVDADQAKRHLLDALSLAPRFREGHEWLRQWSQ